MERVRGYFRDPYNVLIVLFGFLIFYSLILDTPENIFNGYKDIILSSDILLTDYVAIGGFGAALINSGISGIITIMLLKSLDLKANGSIIMSIWVITGFCFFGKNVVNMMPIILGGYLYSVYKKEPFMRYSLATLLATALAPVVSQTALMAPFPTWISISLGIFAGVVVGFIIAPISSNALKAHGGFNLYNVGFSAGILGILYYGIFKALGKDFDMVTYWDETHTLQFVVLMFIISTYLFLIGILLSNKEDRWIREKKILKSSGRLVSDFYGQHKGVAYINMGISGFFITIVALLCGGVLNGPIVGGLFTVIGFSCFGKHIKNMTPVIIGAVLCAIVSVYDLQSPGILVAIVFSTTLAPIAGTFGFIDGVIAGFLHILIVTHIGTAHGGLNLYNNGFAAGLVAMILVPLVSNFRKGDFN